MTLRAWLRARRHAGSRQPRSTAHDEILQEYLAAIREAAAHIGIVSEPKTDTAPVPDENSSAL